MQVRREINDGLVGFLWLFWAQKTVIILPALSGFVIGYLYISFSEEVYYSSIEIQAEIEPLGESINSINRKFEQMFYSKQIFTGWKENRNLELTFQDLGKTKSVNGYDYTSHDDVLTNFSAGGGSIYLNVRSSNPKILDELFQYLNFVNDKLTIKIILDAKKDLSLIGDYQRSLTESSDLIIDKIVSYKRFLRKFNEPQKFYKIFKPSVPLKAEPKATQIYALLMFFGLFSGLCVAYIRAIIWFDNRRESKAP